MPGNYDRGNVVRLSATFTNSAGAAVDPTTVIAKYRKPDGTVTTKTHPTDPEVVKDGTGLYHIDLTLDQEGTWVYRFEGTGAAVAAAEASLHVQDSIFY